jgi:hypothetical protein
MQAAPSASKRVSVHLRPAAAYLEADFSLLIPVLADIMYSCVGFAAWAMSGNNIRLQIWLVFITNQSRKTQAFMVHARPCGRKSHRALEGGVRVTTVTAEAVTLKWEVVENCDCIDVIYTQGLPLPLPSRALSWQAALVAECALVAPRWRSYTVVPTMSAQPKAKSTVWAAWALLLVVLAAHAAWAQDIAAATSAAGAAAATVDPAAAVAADTDIGAMAAADVVAPAAVSADPNAIIKEILQQLQLGPASAAPQVSPASAGSALSRDYYAQ